MQRRSLRLSSIFFVVEINGRVERYISLKEGETLQIASDRSVKLTRTDKYSDALI